VAALSWTEEAFADLETAFQYLARDSITRARTFVETVLRATEELPLFPASGRVVPELGRDDVRELLVLHYRVVYQAADEVPVVLRVLPAARRLPDDLEV
jgi:plasmid stabilization system protein ParE